MLHFINIKLLLFLSSSISQCHRSYSAKLFCPIISTANLCHLCLDRYLSLHYHPACPSIQVSCCGRWNCVPTLYFCGRLNDVIRAGGETVFAPEVEATIIQHPGVDQCAVFELPDQRFGECVCAAIVMKDKNQKYSDYNNIFESIRSFYQHQKLSGYKRPKKMYILHELPRNSSGKVF